MSNFDIYINNIKNENEEFVLLIRNKDFKIKRKLLNDNLKAFGLNDYKLFEIIYEDYKIELNKLNIEYYPLLVHFNKTDIQIPYSILNFKLVKKI